MKWTARRLLSISTLCLTTAQASLLIVTSAAASAVAVSPAAGSAFEVFRVLALREPEAKESVFPLGVFFFSLDADLSLVRSEAPGGEVAGFDSSGPCGSEGDAS